MREMNSRVLQFVLLACATILHCEVAHADMVLVYPADRGDLPLFGRDLTFCDTESGELSVVPTRTIQSRLNDYFHPCVKRSPLKDVSSKSIKAWGDNRFKRISLKRFDYPKQIEYRDRLRNIESVMANVAAEYYRYEVKVDFSSLVSKVNKFYLQDFDMKWEGLAKWSKYDRMFNDAMSEIEEGIHGKMNVLDIVHKKEFEAWADENSVLYNQKKKSLADAKERIENSIRLNLLQRETERAKAAALAAERQAAEAEAAAREAEAAIYDARRAAEEEYWRNKQQRRH